MDLLLIRHGRPERIDAHVVASTGVAADPSLTDIGRRQADAVAEWLQHESIDAIYSSPMRRARETAEPLAALLGMDVTVKAGIEEFDSGEDYVPMEEVKTDTSEWRRVLDEFDNYDYSSFRRTVRVAVESIVADNRGRRVAVFCHGGVINAWAAEILGLEKTMFFGPEYTSISRFRSSSSGVHSIATLNESAHLRADRLHRMP